MQKPKDPNYMSFHRLLRYIDKVYSPAYEDNDFKIYRINNW